jgi:tetratricopeptide (TPR) repeat protein
MRHLTFILIALIFQSCLGSYSEGERHFRRADYEKAISEFSKTLFLHVTDINSLHLRARSYEELEKFENAILDYERILDIDPQYAQAHAGIGKVYWKKEDYKNAEKHLLIAANHDGEDYEILFLLGRSMLVNENYESADEFLQLAKELNPEDSRVYFYQGMARSQIGEILGAAGSFNMCLKYDPDNLPAKYNRGLIRMLIGNAAWALDDFEEVLQVNPDHVEALARRGAAKKILGNPGAWHDLRLAANRGSEFARLNLKGC